MEALEQNITTPDPTDAETRSAKWRAVACLVFAGVVVVLIFAASWAPESQMTKLRWMPEWAARFADRDPNIRTAIPFIPLAFLLVLGFSWSRVKRPHVWALTVGGLCLLLSELGQRFLPNRTADVKDLMWGGLGIVVGTAGAWGARMLKRRDLNRHPSLRATPGQEAQRAQKKRCRGEH